MSCEVAGCESAVHAKGYCNKHYLRWWRRGCSDKPRQMQKNNESHGYSRTPTYASWCKMWQRCLNINNEHFDKYGGRGISVCERWRSFIAFLNDMGEKPDGCSLVRVDNDGDYCPENCIWGTPKQRARQRDRNTGVRRNNSSGVNGVSFCKKDGLWRARITVDGYNKSMGYFDSLEEAAEARKIAEVCYWGEEYY